MNCPQCNGTNTEQCQEGIRECLDCNITFYESGDGERDGKVNEIIKFIHCKKCMEEMPKSETPMTYSSLQVGFTVPGIQVWCKRHNIQVVHLDLLGQKVAMI